jgi:hypothetical protein
MLQKTGVESTIGDSHNIKNFEIITISRLFFNFLKKRYSGSTHILDYSEMWEVMVDEGKVWTLSKVLI